MNLIKNQSLVKYQEPVTSIGADQLKSLIRNRLKSLADQLKILVKYLEPVKSIVDQLKNWLNISD